MSKQEMTHDGDEVGGQRSQSDAGVVVRNDRVSYRTTAFVLASLALAVAGILLALQYFVAERIPELTEAKLETAKKLWQEHGPASYDMDIELRGAQPGLVHIEVQKRVVTATTRDGRVPPQWTWDTWSVPGMFDTLTQDLQIAEDPQKEIDAAPGTNWQLRCEFDAEIGVPRRYHRVVSGGPEVYWRVTNFEAK